jgi:hypothetical protein
MSSATPTASRAVARTFERFPDHYEVGWLTASGEVSYSKVTSVAVGEGGEVRIELAEPSTLSGVLTSRTFAAQWTDAGGNGDLCLEFVPDYSVATGWWRLASSAEKRDVWLRRIP